jgi:RNA polymerase sigma-70 factor (ECF subfamily)
MSDLARREKDRAFEAEALRWFPELTRFALSLTRNEADADDLVQETFLRAYRGFDGYQPGSNIRAWLFTILHRARTDTFRRQARSPQTVELPDEGPAVAPPQSALEAGGEAIERALLALPDVFREAVVLRDLHDFTYDEIARMLEIPVGTVMSRIHRGRALLRTALAGSR